MSRRERRPGTAPVHPEDPISKSERKRRAHRRQALGRRLTALSEEELAALRLPEALIHAIADYRRFPSHEARRRQLQFIGRLMRDVDEAPLETALAALQGQSDRVRYEFHRVEQWRERLLAQPEALTAFLAEYPDTDSQQLRHHLRQVGDAADDDRRRGAYRALFRFLRDAVHPA